MSSRPVARPASTGADRWFEIKSQVHTKLLGSLSQDQLKGLNKESIRGQIANVIERLVQNEGTPMTVAERDRVTEEILDEVFGSLDEARRQNVVQLLRGLHDRFEQVIIITHIEQVREGLDRVISVRYDEETGGAMVAQTDPAAIDEHELLLAAEVGG